MSFNCSLEIPNQTKLDDNVIYVGRPLLLKCEGNYDKSFDFSKAQFKLDEKQKFDLKILKAEARSVLNFDVEFVTYKAGSAEWPDLVITDGKLEMSLGSQKMTTASVIKESQDGKPPEAYGMLYPLPLVWPWLYTVLIILILATVVSYIIARIRRAARYAKLVADLSAHRSAISADLQFYRSLRLAEKKEYPLEDIEKAFRLYILRKYDIPTLTLTYSDLKNFLKEKFRIQKSFREKLLKILLEIDEFKEKEKISPAVEQRRDFSRKLMKFVDQCEAQPILPAAQEESP